MPRTAAPHRSRAAVACSAKRLRFRTGILAPLAVVVGFIVVGVSIVALCYDVRAGIPSHAERVGRRPENHGSKPTTISVGFRGKAILGIFSIRVRVTDPNTGQIWPDEGVRKVRKSAFRGISVE